MEDILRDFLTGNPDLWQIVVGLIILIALFAQRLAGIREAWFNYRKGLSNLILEKHKLEVLKLQYEIEAIKKTHELLEISPPEIPGAVSKEVTKEIPEMPRREMPPSHTWTWLIKHPIFGEFILRSTQIIVGFYLLGFGVGIVMMPFMGFIDSEFEEEPWILAVMWLFYVLLTYACFKGYRRIKNWIKEFRMATQKAESKV